MYYPFLLSRRASKPNHLAKLCWASVCFERTSATRLGPFSSWGGKAARTAGFDGVPRATVPSIVPQRRPAPCCRCAAVGKFPACNRRHAREFSDRSSGASAPSQPIAFFQPAEHALDLLLPGEPRDHLFGRPVQTIGQQCWAAQAMRQQPFESGMIEIELQMPAAFTVLQFVAHELGNEGNGQPAGDLVANPRFREACPVPWALPTSSTAAAWRTTP